MKAVPPAFLERGPVGGGLASDLRSRRMLERISLDALGGIHVLFGFMALGFGAAVFPATKGSRLHRRLGKAYAASMFALNGTALMIYDLFGGFGPFHWAALASLATLIAGLWPLRSRTPRWVERHAIFMCWSYVGLMAATAAEVASRVPGWDFGASVIASSIAIIVLGGAWIHFRIGRTLQGFHARREA